MISTRLGTKPMISTRLRFTETHFKVLPCISWGKQLNIFDYYYGKKERVINKLLILNINKMHMNELKSEKLTNFIDYK